MGRPSNAELAQRKALAESEGEQSAPAAPEASKQESKETVVLTPEKIAEVEIKADHGFKLGVMVTVDYKGKKIAAVVIDVKTINMPKLDERGGFVFVTSDVNTTSKGIVKRNIQLFNQLERFDVWGFHPAFQDKVTMRDLSAEQLTHI
jgi:hypothetical protein